MAIATYSLSIAGTAYPWEIGSSSPNTGASATLEPYNTHFCDGTATNGATAGQNSSFLYGKSHTHAGETGPTTLAVTGGQIVVLKYNSGTINTQGSGVSSCGPAGVATTGLTPLPPGESDTKTMPTNVIKGFNQTNGNGTVNTTNVANSVVTWVSGTKFQQMCVGNTIWINNVAYTILTVTSNTSLTLSSNAGAQSGVNYFFWGAKTNIGGIIGAFTDSSGNIVGQPFDWAGYGGFNPAAFTLTSCGSGTYTGAGGSMPNGGSNAYAGLYFTITGFTNSLNNGTFVCTASTTNSLALSNPAMIAETHAGTATQISFISLKVPVGATILSLGINDTQLYDNTGSFSMSATVSDSFNWFGDVNPFAHYPMGPVASPAFGQDQPKLRQCEFLGTAFIGQMPTAGKLIDTVGQLFPRGNN